MTIQTVNPFEFGKRAQQIRAQVALVLKRWGLLPRFKRWRLTQDPETGMAVLFGILNNKFIATHTSIPFSDYFAPPLLHDLANEVKVQVVSCNSDTLRYAFVLERGQIKALPTHIDYPFTEGDQLFARVIYEKKSAVSGLEETPIVDQPSDDEGIGAFLKVFDDIKRKDHVVINRTPQKIPSILSIDPNEFNKRVATHEANHIRHQQLKELFDQPIV